MPGRVEPEPTPEQHWLAQMTPTGIGDPAGRGSGEPGGRAMGEPAGPAAGEPAAQVSGPRRRMRGGQSRRGQRSIRSTIMMLLVIPMITLLGLLAYALTTTIPGYVADRHNITVNSEVDGPLQNLFVQLGTEASLTYERDNLPAQASRTAALRKQFQSQLQSQRLKTNSAIAGYQSGEAKLRDSGLLPTADKPLAAALDTQLGNVPALRADADKHLADPLTVFKGYLAATDDIFPLAGAMPDIESPVPVFSQSVGTLLVGQTLTDVETETVLVDGALESGGVLNDAAYQLFQQTVDQQRQLDADGTSVMEVQNEADPYVLALDSSQFKNFAELEDAIITNGAGSPVPVTGQAWAQQATAVLGLLSSVENDERATVNSNAQHESVVKEYELFGVGGTSVILVLISSVLLLRFSRRVSRELRGLRVAAQDLAFQRLPGVVNRLRAGEDLDAGVEVPPLRLDSKTQEVTETAEAFSAVQRTAAQAAIEQAMLRKAVSNVFRRLARRNQGLLQRQLKMLDEMERGTHDPDALAQLFRLDHLTTRMRRQAEGLIILSGAAPGRGWRQPVQVVEVLRGAIGEIEDYVRVDLTTDSPDYLQGVGVADVTHLLAELIENAVSFSPPATRVHVRGGRVANGYVVEIEDRGLGIATETRAQLNHRLAEPPDFDVADSDQLGLFVVSRLAARHGIKVSLRASSYGGITAIVLLPPALVVTQEEAAFLAAREYGGAAGRHTGPMGKVGGRGLTATAVGAAADALTGRRRRADVGPVPAGRGSGPLPLLSAPPSVMDAPPTLPSRADRPSGTSFPGAGGHPSPPNGFPAPAGPYASPPNGSPVPSSPHPGAANGHAPANGQAANGYPPANGQAANGHAPANGQAASGYPPANGYAPGGGQGVADPFAQNAPAPTSAANAPVQDAPPQNGYAQNGHAQNGYAQNGYVQNGYAPDGRSGPGAPDGDGLGNLPRRQKMASLAPQLRDPRPEQSSAPRGPLPGKSPEQARALMSSIQRGLRSGRVADVGNSGQAGPDRRNNTGPWDTRVDWDSRDSWDGNGPDGNGAELR